MNMHEYAERVEGIRDKLYRTAVLCLGSASDAEEALDEAVYRGLKACKRLREPAFFDTWMTRILLNVCHDIRRERKRMIPTAEFPDAAAPDGTGPADLRDCLLRLDEKERTAVLLYYIEGYDIRQTAAILRVPQGTVKSRLSRGRKQLREFCREEVFEA